MNKILITGICGFVGSTLAKELANQPWVSEIVGIDNLSRPGSELNRAVLGKLGIRVYVGDLRNASDVDALETCDWVIDAAANPSVLAAVDGKTSSRQLLEHNLLGTINLLEYCKARRSGFILLSTSRVYSIPGLQRIELDVHQDAFRPVPTQTFPRGASNAGIAESFSTEAPVSLYGATKLASEQLALEYAAAFDVPVWINRCGVLAGAGQFGHPGQGIFAFWIHSYRERRPLRYIGFGGQGFQVRDCLHPRDLTTLLAQQIQRAVGADQPRVVNVSGGVCNSMSLAQLSAWCDARFAPLPIGVVETTRSYDLPWVVLDATACGEHWAWTSQTSLEEILEEIAEFAERTPDWLEVSRT